MRTATPLIEMHYLPCIAYIQQFNKYTGVVIETHEYFVKQTYRNRCSIYGANGKQDLIIPVKKKSAKIPIKDLEISYAEDWQHTHFMAIHSAYKSSPYYDYFEDEIRAFYTAKEKYLIDFNQKLLVWCLDTLKLNISIQHTQDYESAVVENIIDLRNTISPKKESNVELPKYLQVFQEKYGFMKNLSILDWVFNDLQGARSFYTSS
jgi:hypothetical protein